jgi:hypothetical protein
MRISPATTGTRSISSASLWSVISRKSNCSRSRSKAQCIRQRPLFFFSCTPALATDVASRMRISRPLAKPTSSRFKRYPINCCSQPCVAQPAEQRHVRDVGDPARRRPGHDAPHAHLAKAVSQSQAQQISSRSDAPRPQERLRLASTPRDQLFTTEKLNRLGPAVIYKRFVSHRSVESQPIPRCNSYLSAYAQQGGEISRFTARRWPAGCFPALRGPVCRSTAGW